MKNKSRLKSESTSIVTRIIFFMTIALIIFLVLVPIGFMIYESFTTEGGSFTFSNFIKYLSKKNIIEAIINTLVVALSIGVLSAIIGITLAFGVSRTNMKFKNLLRSSIIISIMTPPFLITLAYIIFAGPNNGLFNQFLRGILNLETNYGPINIYSIWALVILGLPMGIATIFLMVFPALENMDPYLEEAARMSGSNTFVTAMKITLPLVKPAIFSGIMLNFGQNIAMYGVPRMLNINVLTLAIRESVMLLDFKAGAVLSVLVTIFSLTAIFLYRHILKSNEKYQTISAKGFRPSIIRLGKSKYVFTGLGLIYALFSFIIPYIILIITSFMKSIGNGFILSNFYVDNYINLIKRQNAIIAFKNSLVLAFSTSTIIIIIGLIAAYIIVRLKVKGSGLLEYLCNMPMGISGTALALGLIFMYLTKPLSYLNIYGTLGILLIAYVTKQLPLGVRYCQSSIIQISSELEEASRISGASWIKTMGKITIPLAKTGIIYAWILSFINVFPELSSSTLLRNAKTDVVATAILDLWDGSGGLPQAAAFGTVVCLLITLLVMIAQKIAGQSMLEKSVR